MEETEVQIKIKEHIKGKVNANGCPMCGSFDLIADPLAFRLPSVGSPFKYQEGEAHEELYLASCTCDNCGFTILFSAGKIGMTGPEVDASNSEYLKSKYS